jgi:circadian clock protein KaiB
MTEKNTIPEFEPMGKYVFQLYVSGMSMKSMEAIENINKFCNQYLEGNFELEIIDIYKHPEAATAQHIICSPSLLKLHPEPRKILVGTLGDTKKILKVLGIA